jgi:GWxTD domain-containing protein
MRHMRLERLRRPISLALLATAACSSGNARTGPPSADAGARGGYLSGQAPDLNKVYQSMGLIAPVGQMPFVGSVAFLPGPVPDTTLVLVSLSLASRVLNFERDNEQYAAPYSVHLDVHDGQTLVQQVDAKEVVKVPTFKETSRTDESVIWQRYLRLKPGSYQLLLGVKDGNAIRSTAQEVPLVVPRLEPGSLSSPVLIYEAITRTRLDSLPRLLARPRSSVSFSTDSVLPVYFESAGLGGATKVSVSAVAEGNTIVWRDSVTLDPRGRNIASRAMLVPVKQMGVGVVTLNIAKSGSTDTSRTHFLVTLGDDLPIASFEEMLRYLKYFATNDKLRALREAPIAQRPQAWATFLRETDPNPATGENEALRDYFNRIRTANLRFKDDAILGWQSDRGTALVGLGEPDNIIESNNIDPTGLRRQEMWEYNQSVVHLRLIFTDYTGNGRFRLTSGGMSELESAIRRKLAAKQ